MRRRKKYKNKRLSASMDKFIGIIQEQEGDWETDPPDIIIHECWSSMWPVRATEKIQNSAETMTVTHTMRIEYTDKIDNDMKIKYGLRTFNIVGIIDLYEDGHINEITAEEIL